VVLSKSGDSVLLLRRDRDNERVLIAVNVSGTAQSVNADAGWADTLFDAVYGAAGQVSTDAAGMLAISIAARSTAVYYAATP
jgi:hypothetical protein